MTSELNRKIERYFSQFPVRVYSKGQIIIQAWDEPQYVFYLLEGRVSQYDISYRGDEIIINIFRDGTFFPMLWATTRLPNKYFFEAEIDCKVHLAPVDETIQFLKKNPDVLFDLLSRVYVGIDGVLGRMIQLMSGSARSRLLYELIIECRRFGSPDQTGSYTLDINESRLAARTGLSRETVSREMQKLVKKGYVHVSRNSLRVQKLDHLEKIIGSEI